ncbi:MAG: hypothetical protein Solivirus1_68 [Solivirus sp.]|uniref:Uncharacterized protein n=1 Tax=Solivirus sp. TaxID=2487772 RepID=A0A3G5AHY2_9VIRU|nr:MAG: hypothetical protein Solivirus1_68 [Solivirus sp.]
MPKRFGKENENSDEFLSSSEETKTNHKPKRIIEEDGFGDYLSSDNDESSEQSEKPCYEKHENSTLKIWYIVAILIWIVLLALLGLLPPKDIIEVILMAIPIIAFIVAIVSIHTITESIEQLMLKANLLTLGLLVALPLINWSKDTSYESKETFMKIAATAIILSMLTLIDWWVDKKYLYLLKHTKSIVQTYAIVLLMIGLYKFFCEAAYSKEPVGSGGVFAGVL